jgi:hypothetical protein
LEGGKQRVDELEMPRKREQEAHSDGDGENVVA